MKISKRKYYCNYLSSLWLACLLIFIGGLVADKYLFHIEMIHKICRYGIITIIAITLVIIIIMIIANKGIKNLISKYEILNSLEKNLISINAYIETEGENFLILPKIKIKSNTITIKLTNLFIRSKIEQHLNSFSTALAKNFVVEDYYITQNNAELILVYEDIKNYKPEKYTLAEYIKKIQSMDLLDLYFDRKHQCTLSSTPHILVQGKTGSGKSYLVNQIVIQSIVKGYEVAILDIKRSYGMFKTHAEYYCEIDDILNKLKSIEIETYERLHHLEKELDKNPQVLAVDLNYKPILLIIEEFISLQSVLDKKQKEELDRILKSVSSISRICNIHTVLVMQSASTQHIDSSIRHNFAARVSMGNCEDNIRRMVFSDLDIPMVNQKLPKGHGLILLDDNRVTLLRVPEIIDLENFNSMNLDGAVV